MGEFEELLDYYLTTYAVKKGWTKDTLKTKKCRLYTFVGVTGVENLSDVDNEKYEKWLYYIHSCGHKMSTINSEIITIRTFLSYVSDKGHKMPVDLTEILTYKIDEQPERTAYTETEIKNMLLYARDDRDRLFLLLGFYGGLRLFEVAKLEKGNISGRQLGFYGKGTKYGTVVLPEFVAEKLRIFCVRNNHKFVFPSRQKGRKHTHVHVSTVARRCKEMAERAGFGGFHMHQTRYSLATEMKNRGVKPFYIQQALRHESVKTTEKYIQWNLTEYIEAYDEAFSQTGGILLLT
jgi:integrase